VGVKCFTDIACALKIKGKKRKMQKLKNKTFAILIAAILTISMGASIILLPNADAHTPPWSLQHMPSSILHQPL
jgi:hypothetical protein